MKNLFILITLFLFGFDHVEKVKNSFGFIKTYYSIQVDPNYKCKACLTYSKDLEILSILNKEFKKNPYIKASAFVLSHSKENTLLSTSYHVCESIKEFQTKKKFKELGDKLMQNTFDSNLFLNSEITKMYKLRPKSSILEFNGNLHNVTSIVFENKANDICFIETQEKWGEKVTFSKNKCYYEKAFNMSASGGFYEENAAVLREGYVNNVVPETRVDNNIYKNHLLYTLYVLPGASGSGVFNKNGELCGNINISYAKIGVSFGASSDIIHDLLENFLNSPLGSSYVVKE